MQWDDWILKPRGVHSNFCSGSCRLVSASASIHDQVQSVLNNPTLLLRFRQVNNKEYLRQEATGSIPDPALLPCCRALPPLAALDIVRVARALMHTKTPNAGSDSQWHNHRDANP